MTTKILIFGITGDLAVRKLLPALKNVLESGACDDTPIEVIGVSRHQVDVNELVTQSLGSTELAKRISMVQMNLSDAAAYHLLRDKIDLKDDQQLLVYLAVPPTAASQIVYFIGEAGLTTANVKLLFEKPFGVDYASAVEVIERTAQHFKEEQIYRIDHYLAKDMAQNIVTFRGRNALFWHLWNGQAIEKIEVTALEKIGIEDRAQFYEQTGAMRDFVQGHLMQLLALTLMDIPAHFEWDRLPQMRQQVLDALELARPGAATRAQYEGYSDEITAARSQTETFVQLELRSSDVRWQDVPIILTTGKAMHQKTSEIRVHFKKQHEAMSNCLVFRIQPHEGISIDLFAKKPGYERTFEKHNMTFHYPSSTRLPDAYEQVLVDAIRSKKSLFACSGEILRSWQILQPILDAWSLDHTPLKTYPKGSCPQDITDA